MRLFHIRLSIIGADSTADWYRLVLNNMFMTIFRSWSALTDEEMSDHSVRCLTGGAEADVNGNCHTYLSKRLKAQYIMPNPNTRKCSDQSGLNALNS